MEISIQNFRNIKEKKIVFNKGINLLKGDSGVGKSTIFESVRWCLYGGMKDIIPFSATDGDDQKIRVMIKTDHFLAVRTNRPNKVAVVVDKKKYKGEDAVSKIKEIFGTKGLWETCSYLVQDEKNFLLQTSQKEKTEIMKEILFEMGREDNDWYKEKFEEYKHKMKERCSVLRGEIDALSSRIKIDEPGGKEMEEYEKLSEEIQNISSLIKKRDKIKYKLEEYEKFENIEHEMKESQKFLEENLFPFEITHDIIESWKICKEIIKRKKNLDNENKIPTDLSREDLEKLEKQTLINQRLSKKYGDDPEKTLKEKIKKLSEKNSEKEWKKWKNLKNKFDKAYSELLDLEKKESLIKSSKIFEKISENGLFSIEKWHGVKKYYKEILQKDTKICPDCGSDLFVDHTGSLKKFSLDIDLDDIEKHLQELKNIKKHYDIYENISQDVKNYNLQLKEYEEEPEPPSINDIDYKTLEKEIKELSAYEKIEEYDFKGMISYIEWNECVEKLKTHQEEIYWDFRDKDLPSEEWYQAKNKYEMSKKFLEEYHIMDSEKYERKKEKMRDLNEKIEYLERVKDVLEWKKIKEKRLEMGRCDEKIQKSETLSQKIEGMINKNLELFLVDFNNLLNEAISYLFDDMTVYLSLYKKNKINKKTKPCVSIEIIYKGNKYESFSPFSGGEKNRISLAFTLVFSKICKSKFVFLDEFMAFLNSERRVQCLNLIRDFCSDKIVINVCHETVEGYYDNVIQVNTSRME